MNRPPKTAGLILDSPATSRSGVESLPVTPESSKAYINREISWLHFARRVMALAEDPLLPLLERVKFAGIMGMLHDEFAMKRIGGLRRRIERKNTRVSPDGRTPREELQLCREELKHRRGCFAGWWKRKSVRRWLRRVLRSKTTTSSTRMSDRGWKCIFGIRCDLSLRLWRWMSAIRFRSSATWGSAWQCGCTTPRNPILASSGSRCRPTGLGGCLCLEGDSFHWNR